MKPDKFILDRRKMLQGSTGLAATAVLAGPLGLLSAQQARAAAALGSSPYGPLFETADLSTGLPLLKLPRGFKYRSMSWAGDMMANGEPVHERHDGMCCISVGRGRDQALVLIRNHESATDARTGLMGAPASYDANPAISGGTSNVFVGRNGKEIETRPSLGGTIVNCAGGPTPWGTWLTCEETDTDQAPLPHGYVFEVPTDPTQATGKAITEMGRFHHEAVAVDPRTSTVFLTEDARNESGFYKFEPADTSQRLGALEQGGKLFMAKVKDDPNASLLTPRRGDRHDIEWIEIPAPDTGETDIDFAGIDSTVSGPFAQGWTAGGLRMSRGEGCWYGPSDGFIYVVDTSAGTNSNGDAGRGNGAVWVFDPLNDALECIFDSQDSQAANNPDNITVSPRGGVVLCEDGGGVTDQFGFGERLLGLNLDGTTYVFAKNNIQLSPSDIASAGKNPLFVTPEDHRNKEWAGACFDPTGRILFVNIQTPGITFAISGPWARGTL